MSAEAIIIKPEVASDGPWLRTVDVADQELLRQWRNTHRGAFFRQETISQKGQRQWFADYLQRDEDFLFLVMQDEVPYGCLGVRRDANLWDIYNVIRGVNPPETKGGMSAALRHVIAFALARHVSPIQATVLSANPAVKWYEGLGFQTVDRCVIQGQDSVVMRWIGE